VKHLSHPSVPNCRRNWIGAPDLLPCFCFFLFFFYSSSLLHLILFSLLGVVLEETNADDDRAHIHTACSRKEIKEKIKHK
jgi:hypothetical protein